MLVIEVHVFINKYCISLLSFAALLKTFQHNKVGVILVPKKCKMNQTCSGSMTKIAFLQVVIKNPIQQKIPTE